MKARSGVLLVALFAVAVAAMDPIADEQSDDTWERRQSEPLPNPGRVKRFFHCPTPSCPEPRCPKPECPRPECPRPECPQPHCPRPECPQPRCSVSCPQPVCPTPRFPNCTLPVIPPFPTCPDCRPPPVNLTCPPPICPKPVCPSRPTTHTAPGPPSGPVREARRRVWKSFDSHLWKVMVTYDHFKGFGFYKTYTDRLTWHQANATCTTDGGHLGVIDSEKEAEIFRMLYQKSELSGWIHVGFHDQHEENNFQTVLGKSLTATGYVKWSPGEPDNAGNEDCGTMQEIALLGDGKCDSKAGFICEVPESKVLGLE